MADPGARANGSREHLFGLDARVELNLGPVDPGPQDPDARDAGEPGQPVIVRDGEPPKRPDGTLAGAALRLDDGVARAVALGLEAADAIDAATRVPADLIGRPDLGRLTSRCTADVVVLDDSLEVTRTLVGGQEVFARA